MGKGDISKKKPSMAQMMAVAKTIKEGYDSSEYRCVEVT
jgi:hypothetical protein